MRERYRQRRQKRRQRPRLRQWLGPLNLSPPSQLRTTLPCPQYGILQSPLHCPPPRHLRLMSVLPERTGPSPRSEAGLGQGPRRGSPPALPRSHDRPPSFLLCCCPCLTEPQLVGGPVLLRQRVRRWPWPSAHSSHPCTPAAPGGGRRRCPRRPQEEQRRRRRCCHCLHRDR